MIILVSTRGIKPEKQLFHNILINVYPKKVRFEDIAFWKDNLRNMLSFELLEKKYNKALSEIPLDDITDFLVEQRNLKIEQLADSIERNNVRVPLIILENGTLLDGNRRYFACHYLLKRSINENKQRPSALDSIPVWVIKNSDIDYRKKQKILAEANFVSDYKVEWTLDVKAKVIYDYFMSCLKSGRMLREKIYEDILDVYGVEKSTVDAYVESIKLAKEFIRSAPKGEKSRYREILQDKFLYFWEFRNKAFAETLDLDTEKELPKLKSLFFAMMANDRFKNFKQIEPMVRAVKDEYAWEMLNSTSGSKIDQIEALYKEQRAIKSAEDRIRNFVRWLDRSDASNFTNAAFKLLKKLTEKCERILKKYA